MLPIVSEVGAYSIQLAALAASMAVVVRLMHVADAAVEHLLWRAAFVAALLLPLAGWWIGASPSSPFVRLTSGAADSVSAAGRVPGWPLAVVIGLGLGVIIRLARVGVGTWRISGWRRAAVPIDGEGLDVRVSDAIDGPVTVGLVTPTILVPARFLELPAGVRRAVLVHERLHLLRRDPLRTLMAEVWCACLWFHPGARLLAARLELAREMCLDQQTVATIGDRRSYAEALLAFGGASRPSANVPAFIHRDQVSRRVAALTGKVKTMTRTRRSLIVTGVSLAVTAATASAAWIAPMSGASALARRAGQDAFRAGDGVSLPTVVHEVKPQYTPEALAAKIEGDVLMSVVVLTDGSVGDVTVEQSLDQTYGLDAAAVEAAEQWRFEPGRKDGRPVPVQVELMMRFTLK